MRILLFGKNGQVAQCIQRSVSTDIQLICVGRDEVDFTTPGNAAKKIASENPDIIINAAAYTAVDHAEVEDDLAHQINAHAVVEIAAAASTHDAHFLHISTDYVFDGRKQDAYVEDDDINPQNVYGRSKLAGEQAAMDTNPDAVIIRTSWVFSEFGGNFVKTMLRLAETRNELTIVDDQIGGPTGAQDIADALLAIARKKSAGDSSSGIYHYQGAPCVSWADFAKAIFKAADKSVQITPTTTDNYPTPAKRPLNTILDCSKIKKDFGIDQPDWRISMNHVIRKLNAGATTS